MSLSPFYAELNAKLLDENFQDPLSDLREFAFEKSQKIGIYYIVKAQILQNWYAKLLYPLAIAYKSEYTERFQTDETIFPILEVKVNRRKTLTV